MDDTCKVYDCKDAPVFHKNISKTYSSDDTPMHVQYDRGNYVDGVHSFDSVTFGGVSLKSQTFILVNQSQGNFEVKSIFGLSSKVLAESGTPPFYTAVAEKVVDKPILTIFLEKNVDDTFGGEITLGDYDTKNCGPIYTTTKSVGTDWLINVTGASFDGVQIAWKGSFALIDTRTPFVILPFNISDIYDKINQTVELTPKHDYHYAIYNLNCAHADKIPDLAITIDGFDHIIRGYQLAIPNEDSKGTCFLALVHVPEYTNLGDPFIRDRCVSQNIKTMEVSFAGRK
uniref:Peptidase A1 domain-containing protein n=1 Tax=Panagrellus redivivus TaxID=6233 RepID=A0A7E4VP37_PANRE